jgi:hypothetical protein
MRVLGRVPMARRPPYALDRCADGSEVDAVDTFWPHPELTHAMLTSSNRSHFLNENMVTALDGR